MENHPADQDQLDESNIPIHDVHNLDSGSSLPDGSLSPRPALKAPALLIVLMIVLLVLGIVPRMRQQRLLAQLDPQGMPKIRSVTVNTAVASTNNGFTQVTLPGNVQSINETTINARTTGYLRVLNADIGYRVRAGQVLAIIEAPDLDQQLVQASADASRSRAGHEQAKADVVRNEANVAQAQSEIVRLQSNLESARATVIHANSRLIAALGSVSEAQARVQQSEKRLVGLQSDYQRTRTRLTLAETTLNRWKELARGGAVSGQDLDESQATYDVSLADVNSSQAAVDSGIADTGAARAVLSAREGDVLAARADVTSAQQLVKAAEAAIESGKAGVAAVAAGVVAARAYVAAARAGVDSSNANVHRYAALRSFERVTAPFDGVITARNVDVGALINAASAGGSIAGYDPSTTVPKSGMLGIARTDILRIQVPIPQTYATEIKQGQTASVTIREMPGRSYTATVFWVSGALDASSRTRMVELRLPNPDNSVVPGMYARATLSLHNPECVCRIPASALIVDADGLRVVVLDTERAVHFVHVRLGRDLGKEVEVTAGLKGGEALVLDPSLDLYDGQHVEIANANGSI